MSRKPQRRQRRQLLQVRKAQNERQRRGRRTKLLAEPLEERVLLAGDLYMNSGVDADTFGVAPGVYRLDFDQDSLLSAITHQRLGASGGEEDSVGFTPSSGVAANRWSTVGDTRTDWGSAGAAYFFALQSDFTANLSAANGAENNDGSPTDMTFTVTLNQTNNTGSDITFDLTDTGTGSATSGEDYTAISAGAQITVADGADTGSLTVQVSEDTIVERTQTVVAAISNPSTGEVTIDTGTATAEIADDDETGILIENVGETEGDGITMTATLFGDVEGGFTVDLNISDRTAEGGGVDFFEPTILTLVRTYAFSGQSSSLTFNAFDSHVYAGERFSGDIFRLESDGSTTLIGRNGGGEVAGLGSDPVTGDLFGTNDFEGGLSRFDANDGFVRSTVFSNLFWDTVAVNDDGSKLWVADRDNGVTEFSLQDTSQSGSATLSFDGNAGEMVSFTVETVDDEIVESGEFFSVSMSNSSHPSVDVSDTAGGHIEDNDSAAVSIESTRDAAEPDREGKFTVSLTRASSMDTTISYTVGGDATSGSDFQALPGSVTVAAGETEATIAVSVLDDTLVEGPETVTVTLDAIASGDADIGVAASPDNRASILIAENDPEGQTIDLSVDISASEKVPSVGSTFTYTLTLTNDAGAPAMATGVEVGTVWPEAFTLTGSRGGLDSTGTETSFNPNTGVWEINSLDPGDSVTLALDRTADEEGTFAAFAEVVAADQTDRDSRPDTSAGTRRVVPTKLSDFLTPVSIAKRESEDSAYVVGNSDPALYEVNLANGGIGLVSDSSRGSGPNFKELSSVAVLRDSPLGLVLDVNLQALFAVNLNSGDRTILSDGSNGDGPAFDRPQSLALNGGNGGAQTSAFVVDSGTDAVIEVDLASGDRRIVSSNSKGNGPIFGSPNSIVLNDAETLAFITDADQDALMSVDLSTGNRQIVSDSSTGSGPAFRDPSSVALDEAEERAFVTDAFEQALFEVDLGKGDRTLLSNSVTDPGQNFTEPVSVVLGSDELEAFVIDSGNDLLIAVELRSADTVAPAEDDEDSVEVTADELPFLNSFTRGTPSAKLTNADELVFVADFSEEVFNVDAADFQVSGATTAAVTNVNALSGAMYEITLSGGDLAGFDGVVGIDLASGHNVEDSAGFSVPETEPPVDETYTLDNILPEITSITRKTPSDETTSADRLVFEVRFSEDVKFVREDDFAVNGDTTATVTKVTGSGDTYEVVVSGGDLTNFNGTVGLDLAEPRTPRSAIPPRFSEVVAFVNVSSSEFNVGDSQTERENQTTTLDPLSSSVTVGEPGVLSGSASVDASWDLNLDSSVEFDFSMASNVSSTSGSSRSHFNKYEYEFEVTEDMPITIDYDFDVAGTGHSPAVSILLHREQQFNNDKGNNAVDSVTNISDSDLSEDGEGVSDTITFDTSAISKGGRFRHWYLTIQAESGSVGNLSEFSVDYDFNAQITLGNPGLDITDRAGNALPDVEPGTDDTYELDNAAPVLDSFTRFDPDEQITEADVLIFQATFSEAVENVTKGDFQVSGGTTAIVSDVGGSGDTYQLTVSGGDLASFSGEVGLDLAGSQDITDVVGNALLDSEPAVDETYVFDVTSPELLSFERHTPDGEFTNRENLTFQVTFDEAVTNVTAADFVVTGTTATVGGVAEVNPSIYQVLVFGGDLADLDGVVGLDLAAGQNITDLRGNALPAGEPATDETYRLDNTAPGLRSFERQTPDDPATNTDSLTFRATFDEEVSSVDPADFQVTGTTATIQNIQQQEGETFDIEVGGGDLADFDGEVGVNLVKVQDIQDPAGNALPFNEPAIDETYLVDNTPPVLESITRFDPDGPATNADTLIFEVVLSEDVAGMDADEFLVAGDTSATIERINAVTDRRVFHFTIARGDLATFDGEVGLDLVANPKIADGAGNVLVAAEPATDEIYTVDNTAPSLEAFLRSTPADEFTNADTLIFRAVFEEEVAKLDGGDFNVTGTTATVTNVVQVSNPRGSEVFYDVTVAGGDLPGLNGVVGLDLAAAQDISDPAGNRLPDQEPRADQTYTLDSIAPVLESFRRHDPATSPTSAAVLTFRATFNEAVVNVSSSDFQATGTTAAIASVVEVDALTYEITLSGGDLTDFQGEVGLNLAAIQNIQDIAGNGLSGVEPATDETYLKVPQGIDLSLTLSVEPAQAVIDSTVQYTLRLNNDVLAHADATGIEVGVVLPEAFSLTSTTPGDDSSGTATAFDSDANVWSIATLSPDESVTLVLSGTADAPGTHELFAEVIAADQEDIDSTPDVVGSRAIMNPQIGSGEILRTTESIAINAAGDTAFVIDQTIKGRLIEVDLSNGDRTVISDDEVGAGPGFIDATSVVLNVAEDAAFVTDRFKNALFRVDLTTGNRTVLSSPEVGTGSSLTLPSSVVLNATEDTAFVVGRQNLFAVELETGDRTVVSDVDSEGSPFETASSIVLNDAEDTAYVTDRGVSRLFGVSLTTGERTIISGTEIRGTDQTIGLGPIFSHPDSLILNDAEDTAFVASGRKEGLFSVDLATGDRSVLSGASTGSGPPLGAPTSVVLDASEEFAFVTVSQGSLFKVDLSTGDRVAVSGKDGSYLRPVSVAIDQTGETAYLTDDLRVAVIELDLLSSQSTVVSGDLIGSGPTLVQPLSIALMPSGESALVADPGRGAFEVDLETGNRGEVAEFGNEPNAVAVNGAGDTAFLTHSGINVTLFAVDLASGDVTIVSGSSRGSGPSFFNPEAVVLAPEGDRAFVAGGGSILAVELSTGDRTEILDLDLPDGAVGFVSLDLSEDGNTLFVAQPDRIRTVNLADSSVGTLSGRSLGSGIEFGFLESLALGPAGEAIYAVDSELDVLFAVDILGADRDTPVEDDEATVALDVRVRPALDVNADGFVTPIDALLIINFINANGGGVPVFQAPSPPPFLDTNGSGTITPIDALLVINFLNARTLDGGGEGELVAEGEGGSAELGSTRLTAAGKLDPSLAVDFSSSAVVGRNRDISPIEVPRIGLEEERHEPLLALPAGPLSHETDRPIVDRFEWADPAEPGWVEHDESDREASPCDMALVSLLEDFGLTYNR